jgi:hypothetical protein
MGKINILNPIQDKRVGPGEIIPIRFIINNFNSNATSLTISFKIASDKDFTDIITINPESLEILIDGVYSAYPTGAVIQLTDIGKEFRYNYTIDNLNTIKYLKIIALENEIEYDSLPILISSLNKIEFTRTNPIEITYMPSKVKVTDKKEVVGNSFTYQIFACNNAFDDIPTWEDITQNYLNETFYMFQNKIKTADKWGNIKFICTKTNYSDKNKLNYLFISYI